MGGGIMLTFTNPSSRPPATTDIIIITDSDGNQYKYYWNDVFKSTLKNMSTQVSVSASTSSTTTHNLGYNPKVTVFDSSGNSVGFSLTYVDGVSFTVDFGNTSFTGTVEYL